MPPALPLAVFGLPEWAGRLVLVGIVLAVAAVLLWLVSWAVPRWTARAGAPEGRRARQRQTAVSALATGLRYLILVGAISAIAFALAGGGLAAVGGGALIVVVVGFASQRLLVDLIAGFFILFEDQYGVGDVIRLEPSGYTGRVESLGLRTTVLMGTSGERMIVPNGVITGVRTIPDGTRRHRMELLTAEPERVQAAVLELAGALAGAGGPWSAGPRLVRREAAGGMTRIVAILEVDAHRDDAAAWLAGAVAARCGDDLAAPPLIGVDGG